MLPNKFFNRNTYVVGQDGLLYGNLLSDGSVIIWNVREDSLLITPIIQIYPQLNHKKYSHGLNHAITRHNLLEITSFAMNGTMIAIEGIMDSPIYMMFSPGNLLEKYRLNTQQDFNTCIIL